MMETITETVYVDAPGGRMTVEGHRPDHAGPLPGILVLMEAFGVNDHIRSVTQRLANEGYVAFAPDLYYRERESTIPYAHPDRAADRVMRTIALSDAQEERVKDARVLSDIGAGLDALREHPEADPARIAVLGFGMGARLAFLTACRHTETVRAAIAYGADRMVPVLSQARDLHAPVLLLFAGRDRATPAPHIDRVQAELSYLGKSHEVKIYPGAEQGFYCEQRPTWDPRASEDAWSRTLSWLMKHLS